MAFALTYHQQGAQKHPVEGWLEALIEHPSQVLHKIDARHWSERQVVMLCKQTTDTSIDLYWKDGMLRSRHGSGPAPAIHLPVVEKFADRLARKMHGEQGALWFEVLNRTASVHFIGGITIGRRPQRFGSLPARVRPSRLACDGRQRDARQPGREPVTVDHRAGGARDVVLAEQGRR